MVTDEGFERDESANSYRDDKNLHKAGDEFVKAAFEFLGEGGNTWTARGLLKILEATMCYRLAGSDRKVQRIRDLCVALGLDAAESHSPYPVENDEKKAEAWYRYDVAIEGAWYEYVGDVRLIADDPAYETAYDEAEEIYIETGDLDLSYVEQPHNRLFDFYRYVTEGVGHEEPWRCVNDMYQYANEGTLTDWLDYKRETLPIFVDILASRDEWTW